MNEQLSAEIAKLSAAGWQIISQTDDAVQMKKPRKWSVLGIVLFVVLPALGRRRILFVGLGLYGLQLETGCR